MKKNTLLLALCAITASSFIKAQEEMITIDGITMFKEDALRKAPYLDEAIGQIISTWIGYISEKQMQNEKLTDFDKKYIKNELESLQKERNRSLRLLDKSLADDSVNKMVNAAIEILNKN